LPGATKAAKTIVAAIVNKQKIVIYGDYDVDGVCATSILFDFLYRGLNADILPYVPDRFEEGYGLSKKGLLNVLNLGAKLLISVDCGIRDAKLVASFTKKGLPFIITDHHALPPDQGKSLEKVAKAVVHPLLDKEYPFTQICATTVVYKLLFEIIREAKKQGLNIHKADLESYLDLVALATVCDIMPLQEENRIIVYHGLQLITNQHYNQGLNELSKVAKISSSGFDTYHFGFVLGPRLNAAGRIEHALEGVRLLTSKDEAKVKSIALKLNDLNFKRQQITKKMLEEAEIEAEIQVKNGQKLIFVYQNDWNEGVVGLVAGKLNERYHLPVLVANLKQGIVKGSARSIIGFDITEAITQNAEILLKFGGHNQAAGFTLTEENVTKFKDNLQTFAIDMITADMLLKELAVDAVIELDDISQDLYSIVQKFRPFGYGNPEPIFLIKHAKIYGTPTAVGQDKRHLKFKALSRNGQIFEVIGFNMISKLDTIVTNAEYELAGTIAMNTWNGRSSLQIKLKDLRESNADH
jgi:single-stranded-DNA-specific exonuclease